MIILPYNTEEFKEAWGVWKQYKKEEHKFTYKSEISEQASLKKLQKLSRGYEYDAIDIINQSIENGWKGFFKLKNDDKKRSGGAIEISDDYIADLQRRISS